MFQEILINLDKVFNSSPLLGLGVSFIAGILASFSPCIYPMIPITLGVVGAISSASKLRSFLISFVFVLGIATLYTALGIISSLFGILIGAFLINPATYFLLGLVFLILGLSECGLIKLKIPRQLTR